MTFISYIAFREEIQGTSIFTIFNFAKAVSGILVKYHETNYSAIMTYAFTALNVVKNILARFLSIVSISGPVES